METEKPSTFGSNIKRIRELIEDERGYKCTQDEFAGWFGRKRSQIANWETQTKSTHEDKIEEIAWIFGIPVTTLKYGFVRQLGPGWETRLDSPRGNLELPKQELLDEITAAKEEVSRLTERLTRALNDVEKLVKKAKANS